ncbi:hypothetical protein GAY28_00210 [Azospirillum brasilense]|nr:hypothetical protein [Azospirillum brasilense]
MPRWHEFFDAPGIDFPDRDQPSFPRAATLDELLTNMPPAPERLTREPEPMDDLVKRARWWAEVQAAEDPDGGRPEDAHRTREEEQMTDSDEVWNAIREMKAEVAQLRAQADGTPRERAMALMQHARLSFNSDAEADAWLLTSQDDLGGKTPLDAALESADGKSRALRLLASRTGLIAGLERDLDALLTKRRAVVEAGKDDSEIAELRWELRKQDLLREIVTLPGHLIPAAWLRDGTVFGVEQDGETRVPAFQVVGGRPHPLIGQLLQILRPKRSDWEVLAWCARPDTWGCQGRRPMDLLNEDPDAILEAARRQVDENWG